MKFYCHSCKLRYQDYHFQENSQTYRSICDVCAQAGVAAIDFSNLPLEFWCKQQNMAYLGGAEDQLSHNHAQVSQKYLENLINGYDGNEIVRDQVPRTQFNTAIWSLIMGTADVQLTGDFKQDLALLGLSVNYDLNNLDFITREMIRVKYHYTCQYCGRYGDSVDHKNPVSKSADNSLENLILACVECNKIKGTLPYEVFTRLNQPLAAVNQELVRLEQLVNAGKRELQRLKDQLAAQTHLAAEITAPELQQLRQQNKEFVDALDSLQSEYQSLRTNRRQYLTAAAKMEI